MKDGCPNIVILVDSRTRDLPQATLIAHHLDGLGIDVHLEPLESYRGVLWAFRPNLILFNHLTASHLAAYSRRLRDMGVVTAVLPNEGIMYDPDDLRFNAGKFHQGAHIDLYFCWNEPHRQALRENGFESHTQVEVVGVPRFDFYFEPWSRLYRRRTSSDRPRSQILFCTNFVTAKYWELPREHGDKFFAAWKDRIPLYSDYWPAIEAHHQGRSMIRDYIAALAADGGYDVILRPHPREQAGYYQEFLDTLPPEHRQRIRLESSVGITELILECDMEISVETCATALESWIAEKPTLEIDLLKHPLWYMREQCRCGVSCADPEELPAMVAQILSHPPPAMLVEARRDHLKKWCSEPRGDSSERVAQAMARMLRGRPTPDWTKLDGADRRRGAKLRLLRQFGLAYHFDPFMPLKSAINPGRYAIKRQAYEKSITPEDVTRAQRLLANSLADPEGRK